MALTKEMAKRFKWFKYVGNNPLEFGSKFNNPEYSLHIVTNNIIGLRVRGSKIYCIHANSPDIVFNLKKEEYTRIYDNCKGWSGKIGRVLVEAGVGGKDKAAKKVPPIAKKDPSRPKKPTSGLLRIKNMDVSESSNLRRVEYDPVTKIMYVEFRSGAKWAYENVSRREYEEMDAALPVKVNPGDISHGVYFHRNIRGRKTEYQVD